MVESSTMTYQEFWDTAKYGKNEDEVHIYVCLYVAMERMTA